MGVLAFFLVSNAVNSKSFSPGSTTSREKDPTLTFPTEIRAIEKLIDEVKLSGLMEIIANRANWLIDSIVLGSQAFCEEMIQKYQLHPRSKAMTVLLPLAYITQEASQEEKRLYKNNHIGSSDEAVPSKAALIKLAHKYKYHHHCLQSRRRQGFDQAQIPSF